MNIKEYMSLYGYINEVEAYKDGFIYINGYSFSPIELISSYGNTNTKTYSVSPQRQEDGSMPTINEIPTFEIPRLTLNFEVMSLETWRKLKLAFKPNEFLCKYYDWEYDKIVEHMMYFSTQDSIDIFEKFGSRMEYYISTKKSVDIVGTLNQKDKISVTYYSNYEMNSKFSKNVYPNDLFYISNGYSFSIQRDGYKLVSWNTKQNGSGTEYPLGIAMTINKDLILYAQWIESAERTLSFDYQESIRQPRDNSSNVDKDWILNKNVRLNEIVGELPNPKFYLTKDDNLVECAVLKGWYNIPYDWRTIGNNHEAFISKQSSSVKKYNNSTIYEVNGNSTIYAHWIPNLYTLTFDSDGGDVYNVLETWYGKEIDSNIYLPKKDGYTFSGWYIVKNGEITGTKFSFIMPCENIEIKAKWEEK